MCNPKCIRVFVNDYGSIHLLRYARLFTVQGGDGLKHDLQGSSHYRTTYDHHR